MPPLATRGTHLLANQDIRAPRHMNVGRMAPGDYAHSPPAWKVPMDSSTATGTNFAPAQNNDDPVIVSTPAPEAYQGFSAREELGLGRGADEIKPYVSHFLQVNNATLADFEPGNPVLKSSPTPNTQSIPSGGGTLSSKSSLGPLPRILTHDGLKMEMLDRRSMVEIVDLIRWRSLDSRGYLLEPYVTGPFMHSILLVVRGRGNTRSLDASHSIHDADLPLLSPLTIPRSPLWLFPPSCRPKKRTFYLSGHAENDCIDMATLEYPHD
ncbi:hypothetical protein Q7P37_002339 [Cladosporium fusiforme]